MPQSEVGERDDKLHGVFIEAGAIHRIREALQIITHFTEEPNTSHGGMKIRHEVRLINNLLSTAVRRVQ